MELIGIISHQGTKNNGHYTAMTKKEEEWDAITTHITTTHMHQTQAYILMYRKIPGILIRTPSGQNLPCSERRDEWDDPSQAERPPIDSAAKRDENTSQHTRLYPNCHGNRGGGGRGWDERGRR